MNRTDAQRKEDIDLNETRLRGLVNILQYRGETTQAFLDNALNEAITLTGSRLGYIYFYNEDRKEFLLNTWSREVMKECAVLDPQTCYELGKTGLWGEAVRQRKPIILNNFISDHPLKKGYPEGHAKLTNFLTVPVFKGEQIVAVVGVANKAGDYDETDVLQLTLLMDTVWKSVDIKKGEEILRESEERFRQLFFEAPLGIALVDSQTGRICEVNPMFARIAGRTTEEMVNIDWMSITHPDDVQKDLDNMALLNAGKIDGFQMKKRYLRHDGRVVWVSMTIAPVRVKDISHPRHLCMIEDITARQRAEDALLASLAEKEVLLREVHHRVKNNLNAITGLVRMQRQAIKDPETVTALGELDARIRSMALVHEMFYRSGNLARIDFHEYLDTLISHVRMSLASQTDIRFHVAAQGVEMVLDDAVPCGLIVNELIANAIKYAFPATHHPLGAESKDISVTATCEGSTYTITVADNGVGLPAGMDWATSTTLGLHLVKMLGEHQLGGKVVCESAGGTHITCTFNSKYKR